LSVEGELTVVTRTLQLGIYAGALVASLALVVVSHRLRSREVAEWAQKLNSEREREAKLAEVKAQAARYRQLLRILEDRISLIEDLQRRRDNEAEFMAALGKVLNQAPDVSLSAVIARGRRLTLSGHSRSADSARKFVVSLVRSGSFSDMRLRQSHRDDLLNRLTYMFDLDCVYSPPQSP
jgi:Tfp pilus assembly protein PilN